MAWLIDPAHSAIEFTARHMMIATVRGRFDKFGGTFTVNDEHLDQSIVEGQIETASIDTHDPNRDAHLRSPDFFDVANYPVMTFKSTSITGGANEEYQVTGDLTIKDVTRPVTFNVTNEGRGKDPWGNMHWALTADTLINRKDFGLNWNVALETGGWLVSDQIRIHADVELVYRPDQVETEPAADAATAA